MKRVLLVLGVVLGVAVLWAMAVDAQPTYVGADKCRMCHRVEHTSWLETRHAKALESAKASTQWKFDASCLKCHATNNSETSKGVECESCHGPGSDYQKLSVMKDRDKAVAAGLVLQSQKVCDTCHDGKDHHKKVTYTADVHDRKNK